MNDAAVTMDDFGSVARKMIVAGGNAGDWIAKERIAPPVISSLLDATIRNYENAVTEHGDTHEEALIQALGLAFEAGFELGKLAARKAD